MAALLHEAALALLELAPLELAAPPEPLLLEMLEHAASPALAVRAVIAATAATVICRIPALLDPYCLSFWSDFGRAQHTLGPTPFFIPNGWPACPAAKP